MVMPMFLRWAVDSTAATVNRAVHIHIYQAALVWGIEKISAIPAQKAERKAATGRAMVIRGSSRAQIMEMESTPKKTYNINYNPSSALVKHHHHCGVTS
jgi:hypothetical protein